MRLDGYDLLRLSLRTGGTTYQEAAALCQYALSVQEKMYGHYHPSTNSLLNNLAFLYNDQGKYDEAAPLYQRALAIYEKVLVPDHPYIANTLNNLASLYRDQG